MRLDWDEAKRLTNLAKHGIDFADALELFQGPMVIAQDQRSNYGEKRFIGFGMLKRRVMAVVFIKREPDIIRIISLRKANQREQKRYERAVSDRLGKD